MHHCRECFRPKGHFVTLSSHMSVQLVNVTSETTFLTNSFETEVEALTSQGITFSLCPESCWHQVANIFPYIPSSSLTWADHAPILAARDHNFVQIGKGAVKTLWMLPPPRQCFLWEQENLLMNFPFYVTVRLGITLQC